MGGDAIEQQHVGLVVGEGEGLAARLASGRLGVELDSAGQLSACPGSVAGQSQVGRRGGLVEELVEVLLSGVGLVQVEGAGHHTAFDGQRIREHRFAVEVELKGFAKLLELKQQVAATNDGLLVERPQGEQLAIEFQGALVVAELKVAGGQSAQQLGVGRLGQVSLLIGFGRFGEVFEMVVCASEHLVGLHAEVLFGNGL